VKTCIDCQEKAVWNLMSAGIGEERFYCEEHIKRGCSCNMGEDGNQVLDEQGREFPCCEYDYFENGIED